MTKHYQFIFSGELKNSGIRFHAYMGACKLNIAGEIRQGINEVIIDAEGEEGDLECFELCCKNAVTDCRTTSFRMIEKELNGYKEFRIL